MSNYSFSEGLTAPGLKIAFERFLFNEERHRHSQSRDNWKTFALVDELAGHIVAQVHFCVTDSLASSPLKAPFGSFEFSDSLGAAELHSFFTDTKENLRSLGVKKIRIKDVAHQFRPQPAALLNVVLLNSGFRIVNSEINSGIEVDQLNFEDKISRAEVKRLRRCRQEGLMFRVVSMDRLEEIHSFIQSCREERGASLSMSLSDLKETIRYCQNDFLLFGVFRNNELVAASISVKVNSRILYDFYHAHPKAVDQLSPVVALVDGMYSYSFENKFEILDLGTSSVAGQINFSLLNFKAHLGGKSSLKLTFEKDLF